MPSEIVTLKQRPDLEEQAHRLNGESWPTFVLHADMTHWEALFDEFAEYQSLFCEPANTLIALGHAIPFFWNGAYVVPGTLQSVQIDRERNAGR
jgi:hypothetical protein